MKILDDIAENLEEIEEEYRVLNTHWIHPNIPQFEGLYFKRSACRYNTLGDFRGHLHYGFFLFGRNHLIYEAHDSFNAFNNGLGQRKTKPGGGIDSWRGRVGRICLGGS